MSDTTPDKLWTARSVDETLDLYRDWAGDYDADITGMGYATPARSALALRQAGANVAKPVLDFGCGTGLSGLALKAAGFDVVDGMDISPEMLAKAEAKGAYRQLYQAEPGTLAHVRRGDYAIIAAVGVVSLGAAPPDTLEMLAIALAPGGLLTFSYNDATLADARYGDALTALLATGGFEVAFEDYGPHLPGKEMGSTVWVLRAT